jgi:hypothetical protein
MIKRIVQLLEALLLLNRATENLLIDVVSSFSPWLAPLTPAYMTYRHMVENLAFPGWAALAAALSVETLGLSSIQTAVWFWQWNDSSGKTTPRAPVMLAVVTGAFYLTTVLVVNAMLDNSPMIYRIAKALLSSLSVCAGVILALRAGHARRIAETDQARLQRREERRTQALQKQGYMLAFSGNGHDKNPAMVGPKKYLVGEE